MRTTEDYLEQLTGLVDHFVLIYADLEWALTTDLGRWTDCTLPSVAQQAVNAYRAIEGKEHV